LDTDGFQRPTYTYVGTAFLRGKTGVFPTPFPGATPAPLKKDDTNASSFFNGAEGSCTPVRNKIKKAVDKLYGVCRQISFLLQFAKFYCNFF